MTTATDLPIHKCFIRRIYPGRMPAFLDNDITNYRLGCAKKPDIPDHVIIWFVPKNYPLMFLFVEMDNISFDTSGSDKTIYGCYQDSMSSVHSDKPDMFVQLCKTILEKLHDQNTSIPIAVL